MPAVLNRTITIGPFSLPFTPLELLIRLLIPLLICTLGALTVNILTRRITARFLEDQSKRIRIRRRVRRITRILVLLIIAGALASLLGIQVYSALARLLTILAAPFYSSGSTKISVITLILILPVVLLASWAGRLVRRGVETGTLTRFGLDAEQSFSIGRLIRYSAMSLVFLIGLSIIGIDLSAIGVLFGVLGIGIGFGLQFLVADFFAGISLIGMGHIKEGDRISIDGRDGIIRHIRLMNTELSTFENETVIIPNSRLTGGVIHNYSYKDRRVIIVNRVDVSYDSNLEQVIAVLEELAAANPWLQSGSEIIVRVIAFADSGITMELRTWIRDVSHRADAAGWTNLEIWRAFKSAGIEIPFPQRVIHSAPPPFSGDL